MGWFGRIKSTGGNAASGDAPGGDALSPADREALRETARQRIRSGFVERDGLAEALTEYHDDIELPAAVMLAAAQEAVDAEWAARLAEQASWTEPGDYQRVAAAFDELAGQGIIGRMNFTCCQTCGHAEIGDERTPRSAEEAGASEGYPFREWGYTFFHEQDAERLADEPADLFLAYGTFCPAPGVDPDLVAMGCEDEGEEQDEVARQSALIVGRLIVAALRRQGLAVDWPEDVSHRICVTDLRWRMPLPDAVPRAG